MQIIIPTRGRTNQQFTLSFLPPELRKRTTLVCPKQEAVRLSHLYEDVEIVVQPDPDWTIAKETRMDRAGMDTGRLRQDNDDG